MSPTLKLLPRSPTDRRRSSSGGSPLRPVMGLGPLMGDDLGDVFEEDIELPGPMPINTGTRDEIEREHSAVDEVEYLFVSARPAQQAAKPRTPRTRRGRGRRDTESGR